MSQTNLRRTLSALLACACAFLMLPFSAAPSTQAAGHLISIKESYTFVSGLFVYEIHIFDTSKSITEESCSSVGHAKNSAQSRFSDEPKINTCILKATLYGSQNPFLEAANDGTFAFVVRPLTREDFNVDFPDDISFSSHAISFTGSKVTFSKVSPDATLTKGVGQISTVQWNNSSAPVLAALGTFTPPQNFTAIYRNLSPGDVPEIPTDLETVQMPAIPLPSVPTNNSDQDTSSLTQNLTGKLAQTGIVLLAVLAAFYAWSSQRPTKTPQDHSSPTAEAPEQPSATPQPSVDGQQGPQTASASSENTPPLTPDPSPTPPPPTSAQSGVSQPASPSSTRSRFAPPTE